MRARSLSRVVTAAVLVTAVGCGTSTPPGEAVPALRAQLSRVDSALAGEQYASARTALAPMVRETVAARDSGRITDEQANRILAAAARLAAHLPAEPSPESTPSPAPSPSRESRPAPEEDKTDQDKKDEKKKDEDGDGHNSDNGPDGGAGN